MCYEYNFFFLWCNFMLFFAPCYCVFFAFLAIKKRRKHFHRYKVLIYVNLCVYIVCEDCATSSQPHI